MEAINATKFEGIQGTYAIDNLTGEITGIAHNTTGYYVSVQPSAIADGRLYGYYSANSVEFQNGQIKLYFGLWVSDGRVYPEYSVRFTDKDEAIQIATLYGQIAIWDIANETAIPVRFQTV